MEACVCGKDFCARKNSTMDVRTDAANAISKMEYIRGKFDMFDQIMQMKKE